MSHCKNFTEGIQQINFSEDIALEIKQVLLQSALDALETECRIIQEKLNGLANEDTDLDQLRAFKSKQQENLAAIAAQKTLITTEISRIGIDKKEELAIDEKFIRYLADKFSNVLHLAKILSDAPPAFKNLQTKLYVEVLYKLDKKDQEIQLKTLTSNNIQDMLEQAIITFNHSDDKTLRPKCQQIVQMGLFELIHRDCSKVEKTDNLTADNYAHQSFLTSLTTKLIDVGNSRILDNFSEYQNSKGENISLILSSVADKLNISSDNDWSSKEKIDTAIYQRALFHKLRFGQEDRREYVEQLKENLARDLFWARNIRDIEFFTENPAVDLQFSKFALLHYLKGNHPFKIEADPKTMKIIGEELTSIKQKLEEALLKVKNLRKQRRKPELFPLGNSVSPLSKDQMDLAKATIKSKLNEVAKIPVINIDDDGKITIELFYFDIDKMNVDAILSRIIGSGGFGLRPETMVQRIFTISDVTENIHSHKFSGYSLAEINQQVSQLDLPASQNLAYQTALTKVSVKIKERFPTEISQLNLSDNDELLLRKVLELFIFYHNQPPAPANLLPIFENLCTTHYNDVLKNDQLESIVDAAFLEIAGFEELSVLPANLSIIAKAKIITQSSSDRIEKLSELKAAFTTPLDPETTAIKITDIFLIEYLAMKKSLNLNAADESQIVRDITLMAEEFNWLLTRADAGLSVLSEAEELTYFSAIQQIAEAIKPLTINNVQFKIPHDSSTGARTIKVIDLDGQQHNISIVLKTPIRYSLLKPQGNCDFIFSFGGSRGVIAPFAGFNEAYASPGMKKRRMFTHMRLVGVGQYGSVIEVEELLSGLNRIIKKGYVSQEEATFTETAQINLKLRPLISRNDPFYRVEYDVLQALTNAAEKSPKTQHNLTHYWLEDDKVRVAGLLYKKDGRPQQYRILSERAKGVTFADAANRRLNRHSKADHSYHDPSLESTNSDLHEIISLSLELIDKAQEFQKLGFAHNDIKPENFRYKRRMDGTYEIKFIDWATGGFELNYIGKADDLCQIFTELFGNDQMPSISEDGIVCSDAKGRFVKKVVDGYLYGINPRLEILTGIRSSTLPYISPQVLAVGCDDEDHLPATKTILESNNPMMDDWALTAMTFGICNRHAYFALVKGRTVSDYVIPGILEMDGENPLGLKIISAFKYNRYFSCEIDDQVTEEQLESKAAYKKKNAVMYIPSNQREGEPFHIYRRLLALQEICLKEEATRKIGEDIGKILSEVHAAVASGNGLKKDELKATLSRVETCFRQYEKIHDIDYQLASNREALICDVLDSHKDLSMLRVDSLLQEVINGISGLEVLCTYPKTKAQQKIVIAILEQVIDEAELNDKFIEDNAPWKNIFKGCIATGQNEILIQLISKISTTNKEFIGLVKQQGLLHYALEQGLTDAAEAIINAYIIAGAGSDEIFNLILCKYGPEEELPYIKWSTNAFHIAIRNNKEDQLALLLKALTSGTKDDEAFLQALHFCARLNNLKLFQQIIVAYNQINPSKTLTPSRIINVIYPPENVSPYHLFLEDELTSSLIDWSLMQADKTNTERFLLEAPIGTSAYPLLIAAEKGNFVGVIKLLSLGEAIELTPNKWQELFKKIDSNGKNLLNYILEHQEYSFLAKFIEKINSTCDTESKNVLVHLLSNTEPVNPLKNFLRTTTNNTNKFKTTTQILDAICDNFKTSTSKLQQARAVAILVCKEWFLEFAEESINHEQLLALLHNGALSITFRQIVLDKLKTASKEGSHAYTFYNNLLTEVTPQIQSEDVKQIAIIKFFIEREVAIQTLDISTFILSFTDEIDHLKAEVSRISDELKTEKNFLAKQITATGELKDKLSTREHELEESKRLREELQRATIKLEIANFALRINKLTTLIDDKLQNLDSEKLAIKIQKHKALVDTLLARWNLIKEYAIPDEIDEFKRLHKQWTRLAKKLQVVKKVEVAEVITFFKPEPVNAIERQAKFVAKTIEKFKAEIELAASQLDTYKIEVKSDANKLLIDNAILLMQYQAQILKIQIEQLQSPSQEKIEMAFGKLGQVNFDIQNTIKENLLAPNQENFIIQFAKKLLEWITFGLYNSDNYLPKETKAIRENIRIMKDNLNTINSETFEEYLVIPS